MARVAIIDYRWSLAQKQFQQRLELAWEINTTAKKDQIDNRQN